MAKALTKLEDLEACLCVASFSACPASTCDCCAICHESLPVDNGNHSNQACASPTSTNAEWLKHSHALGTVAVLCFELLCFFDEGKHRESRVLPCGHAFHAHCIEQWLSNHPTCPVCRQNVGAEPAEDNDKQSSLLLTATCIIKGVIAVLLMAIATAAACVLIQHQAS